MDDRAAEARRLYNSGHGISAIARLTGLSVAEVRAALGMAA